MPLRQFEAHRKTRALARLAGYFDRAAHHFHQPSADRQAQASAAVLAGSRAIGLPEMLENLGLGCGRDTNPAVLHGQAQLPALVTGIGDLQAQRNLAVLGKFERIAQQIGHDLPQTQGIATHHQLAVGWQIGLQGQPLAPGRLGKKLQRLGEQRTQVEIGHIQFQLAGLDFGEIENVVDDAQQVPPRTLDRFDKLPLLRGQLGFEQQFGHPQHAIHRGADFVAHRGQKLALRPAASLGSLLGHAQFAGTLVDNLLQIAQMGRQPVIPLADLIDHLVKAVGQLVDFRHLTIRRPNIEMPDRDIGHMRSQILQGLDQAIHQARLQIAGDGQRCDHFDQDQPQITQQLLMEPEQADAQAQPAAGQPFHFSLGQKFHLWPRKTMASQRLRQGLGTMRPLPVEAGKKAAVIAKYLDAQQKRHGSQGRKSAPSRCLIAHPQRRGIALAEKLQALIDLVHMPLDGNPGRSKDNAGRHQHDGGQEHCKIDARQPGLKRNSGLAIHAAPPSHWFPTPRRRPARTAGNRPATADARHRHRPQPYRPAEPAAKPPGPMHFQPGARHRHWLRRCARRAPACAPAHRRQYRPATPVPSRKNARRTNPAPATRALADRACARLQPLRQNHQANEEWASNQKK